MQDQDQRTILEAIAKAYMALAEVANGLAPAARIQQLGPDSAAVTQLIGSITTVYGSYGASVQPAQVVVRATITELARLMVRLLDGEDVNGAAYFDKLVNGLGVYIVDVRRHVTRISSGLSSGDEGAMPPSQLSD